MDIIRTDYGIEGDYDDDDYVGDVMDMEIGRLRGSKAGRGLAALFTGGASEMIRRRRANKRARAAGAAAAARQAHRSMRPRTAGRKLIAGDQEQRPLGLGSVTVPAGGIAILQAVTQRPFQAQRLVLASGDLNDILVLEIRVGADCSNAGVLGYPASTFGATAVNTAFQMRASGPGITWSVSLQNPTAGDIVVGGVFLGASAR